MKLGIRGAVPEAMVVLRERIEEWRGKKRKGRRMPEELWAEAVQLAGKYGLHPVSKNVGVSYSRLKQLVGSGGPSSTEMSPKFVEVSPVALRKSGVIRIELRRPDGCEMVIEDADVICASGVAAGFLGVDR